MTTVTSSGTTRGPAEPSGDARVLLRPLAVGQVTIDAGLWRRTADVNRSAAIPEGLEQLEKAGNLRNLEIAAGKAEGEAIGPIFADSDVHKWLEAAAWEYAREPDQQLLNDQLRITALLAAAQADDGYLDSVPMLRNVPRYSDLPWSHELYCAGHLFQAAVAQVRGTGRRELLDVAVRLADHLVATFGDGDGQLREVDGHPVVEMGLVELFRETGTRAYLDLARWFVEARGTGIIEGHGKEPTYFSDRVPVREATTVEGHAVRAVYLGAGAADVAIETGDAELLAALDTQYRSMEREKQYVTGGLGARWEGEAFGDPYELPTDRGYAETCAAIGGVQWAWRMLLATGEARYADQIERMLYNGFLAGVSLGGTEYFYVNPLQLRSDAHADENRSPTHGRRTWFDCACCPPNIMRTVSSLTGYLATADGPSLQLHQYAPGTITVQLAGGTLRLRVETRYPDEGRIALHIEEAPDAEATLALRIPAWADGATLDGASVAAGSYTRATRRFAAGDTVVLDLPMTPRLTVADPRVDAVRGSVAIERGPLVYALEQPDQEDGAIVDDLRIDVAAPLSDEFRPDLLGGVTVVRARGAVAPGPDPDAVAPYGPASSASATEATREVTLTAVPYYAWANRGPQPMRVWVPVL
ncbi:glycoside hydrolase family 127 protein [Promicromonospora panici]|uniref:glycoside hydrolase family 127 protein n=1 Tax=Promicromonospora panici TaxID=2219658 RepID=UPI00101CABA8|nr:beta-L-arabinofuranosidase domain-containing protein [Promicromonospora panici]